VGSLAYPKSEMFFTEVLFASAAKLVCNLLERIKKTFLKINIYNKNCL